MMVIPISLASLLLYRRAVSRSENFVTVTGKARPDESDSNRFHCFIAQFTL